MGLFSLACNVLSAYIWAMSLYGVYMPLSSNVRTTIENLTPATIASSAQQALWTGLSVISQWQRGQTDGKALARSGKKPGRRRKQLTLAESQREELRRALKVLIVWLICKGTEPAFDSTAGYIIPFYNTFKAVNLLIFARFRVELSSRLFDAFITPLGQPQAPLCDMAPIFAMLLATTRFLLSLPFVHLVAASKNASTHLQDLLGLNGVSVSQSNPNLTSRKPDDKPSRLDRAAFGRPPSHSGLKHPGGETRLQKPSSSSSASRSSRPESFRQSSTSYLGPRLDAPRAGPSATSISGPSGFAHLPSARAVSHSGHSSAERLKETPKEAIVQLQDLPPAPRGFPSSASPRTSSSTHPDMPHDIVPPPAQGGPRSSLLSSPVLPGSLRRHKDLHHLRIPFESNVPQDEDSLTPSGAVSDASRLQDTAKAFERQERRDDQKAKARSKRRHEEISNPTTSHSRDQVAEGEPRAKSQRTGSAARRSRAKPASARRAKTSDDIADGASQTSATSARLRATSARTTRSRGTTPQV